MLKKFNEFTAGPDTSSPNIQVIKTNETDVDSSITETGKPVKYEVKILEDGNVIDHAALPDKEAAIKVQNLIDEIMNEKYSPRKVNEEIKYKIGDIVRMFDDEPSLTITKVHEWPDKGNTYDLKSDDGKIDRGNISWNKIKN